MGTVCGGVVATEVCAPLLLLCWLCCWPDDDSKSDTSSNDRVGKHPKKPVVNTREGSSRSHSSLFTRRHVTSSAVSLHLPSTSGSKQPLSAHRSHEEIPSRRKSHAEDDTRYHSAPSVIDEILHRRDWERSTKELYIPLNPDKERDVRCKKHHTNIKSSKKSKESNNNDIKDVDATEFYIGEDKAKVFPINVKEEKQSINECIKIRGAECKGGVGEEIPNVCVDEIEEMDRSGAMHREVGSRFSLLSLARSPGKPPSVEAVGYEGGVCYLAEVGTLSCLRGLEPSRGRHASDGDILAPQHRPESGAFSESDLELEIEIKEERPPDYEELPLYTNSTRETAI